MIRWSFRQSRLPQRPLLSKLLLPSFRVRSVCDVSLCTLQKLWLAQARGQCNSLSPFVCPCVCSVVSLFVRSCYGSTIILTAQLFQPRLPSHASQFLGQTSPHRFIRHCHRHHRSSSIYRLLKVLFLWYGCRFCNNWRFRERETVGILHQSTRLVTLRCVVCGLQAKVSTAIDTMGSPESNKTQ